VYGSQDQPLINPYSRQAVDASRQLLYEARSEEIITLGLREHRRSMAINLMTVTKRSSRNS
jgi:hypothetical protein